MGGKELAGQKCREGLAPPATDIRSRRNSSDAELGLGFACNLGESRFVDHRQVSKHLAIDIDRGQFQAVQY